MKTPKLFITLFSFAALSACTSVTIDEYQNAQAELGNNDRIVVLGRRHSPEYETEPDLISCVAKTIASNNSGVTVIPEKQFVDELYPWFEPRMAPMQPKRLATLIKEPKLKEKINDFNLRYLVWVDGNTQTTNSSGSVGCAIGPGGGGCFGFGSWDEKSDYEASVWDYQKQSLVAKVSADAKGTSYMPALVVPIPLLARVQSNACKGLGSQLREIFISGSPGDAQE
ncbi:hypothetical protein [Pseudoteredinibacter isoporae]|uniref:Lipoprotein n=1 Tax=Pseudoteredinibacter isoporae TaxID=570281 RepID=A0A7X0JV55_9GAMM|nr:hypothetical protein [Pseudoteredinibacter isoporae]MBB6522389.1 hypothetical protein [Pseudoteredinibacter isoporae]NHO87922.1 hypothetical protein [Pseudoteredinibacter isoporae]NIB23747.1 hypothetical protein [Pseudoteredinibacter isoporae]